MIIIHFPLGNYIEHLFLKTSQPPVAPPPACPAPNHAHHPDQGQSQQAGQPSMFPPSCWSCQDGVGRLTPHVYVF